MKTFVGIDLGSTTTKAVVMGIVLVVIGVALLGGLAVLALPGRRRVV